MQTLIETKTKEPCFVILLNVTCIIHNILRLILIISMYQLKIINQGNREGMKATSPFRKSLQLCSLSGKSTRGSIILNCTET